MSRNIDFSQLDPYSRKKNIITETYKNWTGQTAVTRTLTCPRCAGSESPRAMEWASRRPNARLARAQLLLSRGSAGSVRFGSGSRFGPALRRHVSSPRWRWFAPADGRRVSAPVTPPAAACRCRLTFILFYFIFLSSSRSAVPNIFIFVFSSFSFLVLVLLCYLRSKTQRPFRIFIFFDS